MRASFRAIFIASERSASSGTTRFTRWMRAASSASIVSPEYINQRACRIGTVQGINREGGPDTCRTSGSPKHEDCAATAMSQAMTSSRPPASAKPFTAAMIGTRLSQMLRRRMQFAPISSSQPSVSISKSSPLRSNPVEKARPAPVSMIARVFPSSLARKISASSASDSSTLIALSLSGRFRVRVMMGSSGSRSTRMRS
jgi:hypothetical protein